MTITFSLVDLLVLLGCALVISLIILVCYLIKTVKNLNKLIENSESHLVNTLENVDKISEETSTIYTRIIDKVLNILKGKANKFIKPTKTDIKKK